MSRKGKRDRGKKKKGPWAAAAKRRSRMWLTVVGIAAGLVALSVIANAGASAADHPTPRAKADQSQLMPAARYAEYPRVARTYALVAAAPAVIDGLYCYCHCAEHSGHYSLLDCFASDHAARCDVCLSEATIGHDMSQEGASLKQIRAEIDRTYGP